MSFVCKFCENNPSLHTFHLKDEEYDQVIFYSCMSEAKDKNISQIIYHINGSLKLHHDTSTKLWSWIIDSKNFKFEWHFFSLFKELLKIYDTYKSSLKLIKIINMNSWMKFFLNLCTPFMTKELKNKLVIL